MRFEDFAAGLKQLLKAQYLRSTGLRAPTDIGSAREFFCQEFLSHFLPKSVVITSGEVIDSYGHQSCQMDVVLYNENLFEYRVTPKLHLLIVEGCFAAIEVKSMLDKREFFDCLKKCERFKSLQPSLRPVLPAAIHLMASTPHCQTFDDLAEPAMLRWGPEISRFIKPKFYVFAYGGPGNISTLVKWFEEYLADRSWPGNDPWPDLVCILDTGVAYLDDGFAFMLQDERASRKSVRRLDLARLRYRFVESSLGEVAAFAFHLLEAVNISKKDSRLDAMGMSIHLRRYFDLALTLGADTEKMHKETDTNIGEEPISDPKGRNI